MLNIVATSTGLCNNEAFLFGVYHGSSTRGENTPESLRRLRAWLWARWQGSNERGAKQQLQVATMGPYTTYVVVPSTNLVLIALRSG
jgi:hypothetical protein